MAARRPNAVPGITEAGPGGGLGCRPQPGSPQSANRIRKPVTQSTMISKVAMAGAMTRLRLGRVTVAVLAAALLAVLAGGCSRPADLLPAPDGPPAHPHCGTAPVLALGA